MGPFYNKTLKTMSCVDQGDLKLLIELKMTLKILLPAPAKC